MYFIYDFKEMSTKSLISKVNKTMDIFLFLGKKGPK